MRKTCLAAVAVCGLSVSSVHAQENASGWAAYVDGDFATAIELSEKDGTADGYALACRSATVLGGFLSEGEEAVSYLHRAIRLCEKALEMDPNHLVGKMTYAMTIAFEGKRKQAPSLGKAALRHLEQARDLYPDVPRTHAAVGGWHSEVRAAGFFARLALGPSKKEARRSFAKAKELGMTDIPLLLEYAKYLSRDDDTYDEAVVILQQILDSEPRDGYDKLVQKNAAYFKPIVEAGDDDDIEDALKEISAFPRITKFDDGDTLEIKFNGKDK